jgi:hypothetical protein
MPDGIGRGLRKLARWAGWRIGDHPEADIAGAHRVGLGTVGLDGGRTWTVAEFEPDHQAADPAAAIRRVLEGDRPTARHLAGTGVATPLSRLARGIRA